MAAGWPTSTASLRTLELVLAGYDRQNKVHESCKRLMEALHDPQLPFVELQVRATFGDSIVAALTALQEADGQARPARPIVDTHAGPRN